jgi:hypothetical protein
MQSSGQQPNGNRERENAEVEDIKEQASSPLYEFPADQQGMVYPPPPSYYQNMQIPEVRTALPLQPGIHTSLPFQSSVPGSQAQLNQMDVQVPPYSQTQYPGMQPPVKKSYKWVWIIVSIFSVGFLVTCGLCGWGVYQLFNTVINQETGATDVVNNYFQDVQNQRYAQAYQDLQISGLTLEGYSVKARASDTQNGLLHSYVVGQPTFGTNSSTGPDLSQWRYAVDVTRAKTSYPVLVTVEKVGGSWKITYIDRY